MIHFGMIDDEACLASEVGGSAVGCDPLSVPSFECTDLGNFAHGTKNILKAAGGHMDVRIEVVVLPHGWPADMAACICGICEVETVKPSENIHCYTNTVSANETVCPRYESDTDSRDATEVVKSKLPGPYVPHLGFGAGGYRTFTDLNHSLH